MFIFILTYTLLYSKNLFNLFPFCLSAFEVLHIVLSLRVLDLLSRVVKEYIHNSSVQVLD